MSPMQQTMSPDMLTAILSDPRTPPPMRMAAMSALKKMQGGPQAPAMPAGAADQQKGTPNGAPAPSPAAPTSPPQVNIPAALMSGAADANKVAGMARGGAVRHYDDGGGVSSYDPSQGPPPPSPVQMAPVAPAAGPSPYDISPSAPNPWMAKIQALADQSQNDEPSDKDKSWALLQAGLGMLAANTGGVGHPGVSAIGQGALSGMEYLQQIRKERAEKALKNASLYGTLANHADTMAEAQAKLGLMASEGGLNRDQRAQDNASNRDMRLQIASDRMSLGQQMLDLKKGMGGANLPDGTGDDFLAQLPGSDQAVVKKVASGDIDPKSLSSRDGYRNRIIAATAQYDPDYNQQDTAARFKTLMAWSPGGQVATSNNALDTVVGHIGKLHEDINKLDNFNGVASNLNPVSNWMTTHEGKTAVTNFNTDADAVASELAKAYKGSGAVAEGQIKEWRSNLSPNMSKDQQVESLDHVLGLLDSKAEANVKQWNDNMPAQKQRDVPYIYGQKSRETLARINPARYGAYVSTDNAPAIPTPTPVINDAPPGIDPTIWAHATPEEKALWAPK